MDIGIRSLKQRPLTWTLLISLLIHLLFLLFFVNWGDRILFPVPERVLPDAAEKRVVFEIVETPEASETPPEDAELFSDKDAVARDPGSQAPEGNTPFIQGMVDNKNVLMPVEAQNNPEETNPDNSEPAEDSFSEQDVAVIQPKQSNFSRDRLLAYQQPEMTSSQPLYDQRSEGARDLGAISLNTYAWEYAPYLLDLKRRIEKNIFPPPVFTRMGFGGRLEGKIRQD